MSTASDILAAAQRVASMEATNEDVRLLVSNAHALREGHRLGFPRDGDYDTARDAVRIAASTHPHMHQMHVYLCRDVTDARLRSEFVTKFTTLRQIYELTGRRVATGPAPRTARMPTVSGHDMADVLARNAPGCVDGRPVHADQGDVDPEPEPRAPSVREVWKAR